MGKIQVDPGIPSEDPRLHDLFDLSVAFGSFGQYQGIPHIHIVIHDEVDGIPLLIGLAVDVFHEFYFDQGILGQHHRAGSQAAVGEGRLGETVQAAVEGILSIFRTEDLGFQMAQPALGRIDGHPVRELPLDDVHHGGHGQLPIDRGSFQPVVQFVHSAHDRTSAFLAIHIRFHLIHPGDQGAGLHRAIQEILRDFHLPCHRIGRSQLFCESRDQAGEAEQSRQ